MLFFFFSTIVLIVLLSEIIPTFHFKNPFKRKRSDKIEFIVHKLFSVRYLRVTKMRGSREEDRGSLTFRCLVDDGPLIVTF